MYFLYLDSLIFEKKFFYENAYDFILYLYYISRIFNVISRGFYEVAG